MRIAVLGLRGVPDVMGGVETHCEHLYPCIKQARQDIEFCILARAPYIPLGQTTFKSLRVLSIWAPRSIYLEAIVHTAWGLLVARFSEKAAIVHIHAVGPGMLTPFARLLGLRVIFTHHGEDYRRAKWNGFARLMLRFGEHLAIRFANQVISVSAPVAEGLKKRYPDRADRITAIPNGVPDISAGSGEAAEQCVLSRLGVEPGKYLLTVGRLVPEKGIHDLVDAVEKAGGETRLLIVGGVTAETDYARALRARSSNRIIFAGELKREEILPLYRRTSLFVLASHHEGLPIVALEALSAGARVLLSDIAANRELGLNAGNFFPVGDVEVLTQRLSDTSAVPASDPETITARYNWPMIAAETLEVFFKASDDLNPDLKIDDIAARRRPLP